MSVHCREGGVTMTQSSIDGFSTASQMLQALRQRQLSAVELLALHQRRIERYNRRLNAIIIECFEQAREAAEAADAARARGADAPLLGLPITLKESINVRGLPTTAGLPAFAQTQADFDAAATQRLQTAGAVLMGKTNVPPVPNPLGIMGVQGPLARSAADLDLALAVLAGPEGGEEVAWRLAFPPPRHERLSEYRVAVLPPITWVPVDTEIMAAQEELVS